MTEDLSLLFDWRLAVAAGVVALAGVVRGFSGFGSALILTPSLSALYGPAVAVPLVIVLEVALSFQLLPNAWPRCDKRQVGLLTLAAMPGIPLGAWILSVSDPAVLRWAVSGGILAFLAALLLGLKRKGAATWPGLVAAGALSGLTNGASGIGGPPVVLYYLAGQSIALTIRANVIVFFFAIDLVTLPWLWAQGLVSLATLVAGAVTLPLAIVGVAFGSRLFRLATERAFRRVAFAIIAAVALASALAG